MTYLLTQLRMRPSMRGETRVGLFVSGQLGGTGDGRAWNGRFGTGVTEKPRYATSSTWSSDDLISAALANTALHTPATYYWSSHLRHQYLSVDDSVASMLRDTRFVGDYEPSETSAKSVRGAYSHACAEVKAWAGCTPTCRMRVFRDPVLYTHTLMHVDGITGQSETFNLADEYVGRDTYGSIDGVRTWAAFLHVPTITKSRRGKPPAKPGRTVKN